MAKISDIPRKEDNPLGTHVGTFEPPSGPKINARSTKDRRPTEPAPIHPGMTRQQQGAGLGGIGHSTSTNAPDASGPAPLDPTAYGGTPKPFLNKSCPPAAHDMRSRTSPHIDVAGIGRRVLEEGFAQSAADHSLAHGRDPDTGKLPDAVVDSTAQPVRKPGA